MLRTHTAIQSIRPLPLITLQLDKPSHLALLIQLIDLIIPMISDKQLLPRFRLLQLEGLGIKEILLIMGQFVSLRTNSLKKDIFQMLRKIHL